MSIDTTTGTRAAAHVDEHTSTEARLRPNVSGDLPTVLQAAPMFHRAVTGYDRFQVESYVQWAEDELAAADREREHLVARQLETATALEEARELLSHSPGGGEYLGAARRIGSLLAAAADEAAAVRAEAAEEAAAVRTAAEADRQAAVAEAERVLAEARRRAAATATVADRSLAAARAEAAAMMERALATVAGAEQDAARLRAEAGEHLARVRDLEQRTAADGDRLRRQAADELALARLQAREEILRMLAVGREQRRRADAEAVAAGRGLHP